jgi:CRP/FNR family cyclic AMP-dependent transcriptional regulator
MEKIENIIKEHFFFRDLNNEQVNTLAKCASFEIIDPDKYILTVKEEAKNFYLILEGSVSLQVFSHERGTINLEVIQEGEFLGWSWLFSPYKWRFDAKTNEKTKFLCFDAKILKNEMAKDPELGFKIHKLFSQLIIERLQALRFKFLDVLEKYPQVEFEEIRIIDLTL